MKKTQAPFVSFPNVVRFQAVTSGRGLCSMLLAVLFLLGLASRGSAQGTVPEYLSFQGYMEDANGVPLGQATPANYFVVFRIYPLATGGSLLWSERQNVTFDKGNYSVLLGQGSQNPGEQLNGPLSAVVANANSSELYVESTVTINGNDARILPRLRLLPTPYAFLAKKALNADSAANATFATNAFQASFASQATLATTALLANIATAAQTVQSVNGAVINAGTIPQTALAPGILAGLTDPIPDSRLSNNVARRNTTNTFTGNQAINGNLGVSGNQTNTGLSVLMGNVGIGTNNPTAPLDVNGDLKLKGEKPFAFKVFSGPAALAGGNSVGAFVDFDTGWPTNRYFASIVGFHANKGDLNEYTVDNTMITVRVIASTSPPYNWRVQADLRNEGPQMTWKIMAMRVVRELVTDDSWGYANW